MCPRENDCSLLLSVIDHLVEVTAITAHVIGITLRFYYPLWVVGAKRSWLSFIFTSSSLLQLRTSEYMLREES